MRTLTEMPSAAARARYRAVVARVDAIRKENAAGALRSQSGQPCVLDSACMDALEHIRLGAVRTLRALGERV